MTIYFVRPVNGLDTNAGTAFSVAFKTTQKALDTAVAGDEIRLCAEAVEVVIAPIDVNTNNGTDTGKIRIGGFDGPSGLNRMKYTIQADTGFTGDSLVLRTEGFGAGMIWQNIEFDANSLASQAFDCDESQYVHISTYIECHFRHSLTSGFRTKEPTQNRFFNCDFSNNGGSGYEPFSYHDGLAIFSYCRFTNNISHGAYLDAIDYQFRFCEFYKNGLDGLYLWARADLPTIENCTFYENGRHGINHAHATSNLIVIYQNSFVQNGGYGISFISSNMDHDLLFCDYNHFHNNTTDATNLTAGIPGNNNVSGDPLFKSTAVGFEDFTPGLDSQLNGCGIGETYIGARQIEMPLVGEGEGQEVVPVTPQASLLKKLKTEDAAQRAEKSLIKDIVKEWSRIDGE